MPGAGNRLDGQATTAETAKARREAAAAAAAADRLVEEGEDDVEAEAEEPLSVAELLRAHGFGAVRAGSALISEAVSLGRPEHGASGAQAAAAMDLINAVGSHRGSSSTAHRVLRHDLRSAREKLASEELAVRKVAAAEGGAHHCTEP
jgi:hypothetical protein